MHKSQISWGEWVFLAPNATILTVFTADFYSKYLYIHYPPNKTKQKVSNEDVKVSAFTCYIDHAICQRKSDGYHRSSGDRRQIGAKAKQIKISIIPKVNECNAYSYESKGGVLSISGSSPVAIARGFYDYTRSVKLGMVGWLGVETTVPKQWPNAKKVSVTPPFQFNLKKAIELDTPLL